MTSLFAQAERSVKILSKINPTYITNNLEFFDKVLNFYFANFNVKTEVRQFFINLLESQFFYVFTQLVTAFSNEKLFYIKKPTTFQQSTQFQNKTKKLKDCFFVLNRVFKNNNQYVLKALTLLFTFSSSAPYPRSQIFAIYYQILLGKQPTKIIYDSLIKQHLGILKFSFFSFENNSVRSFHQVSHQNKSPLTNKDDQIQFSQPKQSETSSIDSIFQQCNIDQHPQREDNQDDCLVYQKGFSNYRLDISDFK